MRLFGWPSPARSEVKPAEARGEVIVPATPISGLMKLFGIDALGAGPERVVTIERALSVPAIFGAVNFLAGTLAGLPLALYERKRSGEVQRVVKGALAGVLHDAVNPQMTSYDWRKHLFDQVFTSGRGLTFIERSADGQVMNLWPLDPSRVNIRQKDGVRDYVYEDDGKRVIYDASEIIDIPFMLKPDGVAHRSPLMINSGTVALALAASEYGAKFFQNGGVPAFAIKGPFQSGRAMGAAGDDLEAAVRQASREERQALILPGGLDIVSIGIDAQKSQLLELKHFLIEEVARIYSLPPTFLQDLSHGTYSNTEQQDLHFVKHTLKRWVEVFEQEVNLKLFGRTARRNFVKLNVDGLLRGDYRTRMEGSAQAIQTGQLTPNEARALEDRGPLEGGDRLFIQGAIIPIETAGAKPAAPPPAPDDPTDDAPDDDNQTEDEDGA